MLLRVFCRTSAARRAAHGIFAIACAIAASAFVFTLGGCVGPDAPDAEVCKDVIHRLCIAPLCDTVQNGLAPGDDCEGTLQTRTGCGDAAFAFSSPDRQRFLDCRGTLIRSTGINPDAAPPCPDVDAMFTQCPELTDFFKGAQ